MSCVLDLHDIASLIPVVHSSDVATFQRLLSYCGISSALNLRAVGLTIPIIHSSDVVTFQCLLSSFLMKQSACPHVGAFGSLHVSWAETRATDCRRHVAKRRSGDPRDRNMAQFLDRLSEWKSVLDEFSHAEKGASTVCAVCKPCGRGWTVSQIFRSDKSSLLSR